MEQCPKIDLKANSRDKFVSAAGLASFLATWTIPIAFYSQLPDRVPTHFDATNHVDNYGSKATLLIHPTLATFIFGLLTLAKKRPEALNYPVQITAENAARQYAVAVRVLALLRVITMLIFATIEFQTVSPAFHNNAGALLLPLTVASIFAPVTFLILKSRSYR
ncbi:MAG: DUF1648 domain-containing protein [Taibaiella sp.]|nr:DUF1648 domain-containing protein [Taibaiella sp.]